MAVVRKKQDDKNLKILREIVTVGGGNRQCFDCGQKGPTYVNMTIGSFVCTRCSGILRGLTPPHRVKSISMATFTPEEIEFLKSNGNDACAKTWLGLWDPKRIVQQDQRELMVDKYERKRYYLEPGSPLKSLTNNATKFCNSNSNSSSNNNNNNNINNNNNNNLISNSSNNLINHKSSIDNSFKNINLTPPTSRSHSSNGSVNSSNMSNGNISNLKQNGFNGFRNDDSGTQINGFNSGHLNGTSRPVPANKSNLNLSTSSTANSETSSCHSNGFTPDTDFVADFSSANIFDATSVNPLNAFGTIAGHHHQNGFAGSSSNGVVVNGNAGNSSNKLQNGGNFTMNNGSDNFADFDHAPIYNAAVSCQSNSTTKNNSNSNSNSSNLFPTNFQSQLYSNNQNLTVQQSQLNKFLLLQQQQQQQQQGYQQQQQQQQQQTQQYLYPYANTSTLSHNINSNCNTSTNQNNCSHYFHNYQPTTLAPANITTTTTTTTPLANNNNTNTNILNNSNFGSSSSSSSNCNGHILNSINLINDGYNRSLDSFNFFNKSQFEQQPEPHQLHQQSQQQTQQQNLNAIELDSQFNNKTFDANAQSQWNLWQEFKWPPLLETTSIATTISSTTTSTTTTSTSTILPVGITSAISMNGYSSVANVNSYQNNNNNSSTSTPDSIQTRWSLPLSNSTTNNSLSSNGTLNSNSTINSSMPSADRYAALKDLDEQLRESKAVAAQAAAVVAATVVDSFGNGPLNGSANPNPFKQNGSIPNRQPIANPFQQSATASATSFNATPSVFGANVVNNQQNGTTNGSYAMNLNQPNPYDFINNFNTSFMTAPQNNMIPNGPNGCGFGFGTIQQQIATGGSNYNNPFSATGSLNTNNPFL